MTPEILAANLAALAAAGGPADSIASAASDRIRVTETGGIPVAELADATGYWCRLHSARDPAREAAGLIDRALAGKPLPSLVAVLGAGLGWVLDEIERRDPAVRVVVVDPSPGLTRLWMARRSWETWFQSGRLAVATGPDYVGLTRLWAMVDTEGPPPLVVANPPMMRLLPDDLLQAQKAVDRLVFGAISNATARKRFGPPYLTNTLENLARVMAEGDAADLQDLAVGRTVVIIGAGPSLDVNVAALRRANGRAVLVATDTALRPLLVQGVKPDIVVCLDPSDTNALHLQNLPDCRDVWLVAEASIAPAALAAFEGRTFFFRVSNNDPWPWLSQTGLTIGRLSGWGSVVTAAFRLARSMGCERMVFAGLDLAYTSGQPYCRHATFESVWARWVAQGDSLANQWSMHAGGNLLRQPDVGGGEVGTTPTLIEFRDWVVEQTTAIPDVEFVNATGGGILAGGRIMPGTLDEVFESRSPSAELDVASRWSARVRGGRMPSAELGRRLAAQLNGELPQAWRELVGPVGEPRVREALARAARELEAATPTTCQYVRVDRSGLRRPFLPAADTAEAVRSLLSGTGVLFDTARRPAVQSGWSATRFLEAAREELRLLLPTDLSRAAQVEVMGDPLHVPVRFAYEWPRDVEARIQAFEEALAMACLMAPVPSQTRLDSAWLAWVIEAVEPVVDPGAEASAGVPASAAPPVGPAARLGIEFAMAMSFVQSAEQPLSARRWAAFTELVQQGTAVLPGNDLLASAAAWTDSNARSAEHPHWWTGRIRTGTLELLTPVARSLADVPVRVLTGEGLPRSYRACALSTDEALVTPWGHQCSYRVGSRGDLVQLPAWRHVISGEIPTGREGGGLAYDAGVRCVMARPSGGSGATIEDVDFIPIGVVEGTDGRVWWCARDGGVWEGRPGGSLRLVADSVPLSSIELVDSSLMLMPGHYRKDGNRIRLRDDRRWVLDTSTLSIEQQTTGPLGQGLTPSVRGGWEAHAHPFSDVVHLRRQSTDETALLHVYDPLAVVWAGDSLLVVCNDGHVLFFESLIGRLAG